MLGSLPWLPLFLPSPVKTTEWTKGTNRQGFLKARADDVLLADLEEKVGLGSSCMRPLQRQLDRTGKPRQFFKSPDIQKSLRFQIGALKLGVLDGFRLCATLPVQAQQLA